MSSTLLLPRKSSKSGVAKKGKKHLSKGAIGGIVVAIIIILIIIACIVAFIYFKKRKARKQQGLVGTEEGKPAQLQDVNAAGKVDNGHQGQGYNANQTYAPAGAPPASYAPPAQGQPQGGYVQPQGPPPGHQGGANASYYGS